MNHEKHKLITVKCQICGKHLPLSEAVPVDLIRDSLIPTLKESCPNLDPAGYVGMDELNKARIRHAQEMTKDESVELVDLKMQVANSLIQQETITRNSEKEFDSQATRGERIADKVAAFGGS